MSDLTTAKFRRHFHWLAFWSVIGGIAIFALVAGLMLRRYAWDQTEPIRYTTDIDNAFRQGTQVIQIGYLDRYDEETTRPNPQFMSLDYAPGRLAIAWLWSAWVRKHVDHLDGNPDHLTVWHQQFYERARTLHRQYELIRPMLMINIACELTSAAAMFLLVRRYTAGKAPNLRPMRGAILGLIAALFFWFDPALISNAHCWPQWDSWVLPFFLWAVLLASWDFWFCSGAVIAAGAMFKGQILFGAPLLVLWPLFQWRLTAVIRWVDGLLASTAAITAVWLLRVPGSDAAGHVFINGHLNDQAIRWLIYLALIFAAVAALFWNRDQRRSRLPLVLIIPTLTGFLAAHVSINAAYLGWIVLGIILVLVNRYYGKWTWSARWPIVTLGICILLIYPVYQCAPAWAIWVALATSVTGILLAFAPRRAIPFAAAGWISIAMLLCVPIFGGSKGWFDYGIAFGTHHYEKMASEENNNLAALLKEKWGWEDLMAPLITLPPGSFTNKLGSTLSEMDPGVEYHSGDNVGFPLKYFLLSLWIAALVLSAIGAAIHDRARHPRFLLALSAPWIAFFAVMAQMHQRYLLWGASLSSASAVLSPGYAVLHLFLSLVSWTQELKGMADNRYVPGNYGAQLSHTWLFQLVDNWHPGIAWAVLLTAVIYLYSAGKWTSREQEPQSFTLSSGNK